MYCHCYHKICNCLFYSAVSFELFLCSIPRFLSSMFYSSGILKLMLLSFNGPLVTFNHIMS